MKPYFLCILMCLTGYCNDDDMAKKEMAMYKEIIHASNHCEKITMYYWDIEGTKKLQLSKDDQTTIASILKEAKYRKSVRVTQTTERIYMIYMEIIIDKNHPFTIDEDQELSEKEKDELKTTLQIFVNNEGDIPSYTVFYIPEKHKEQFGKIIKSYIDRLVPEKHK